MMSVRASTAPACRLQDVQAKSVSDWQAVKAVLQADLFLVKVRIETQRQAALVCKNGQRAKLHFAQENAATGTQRSFFISDSEDSLLSDAFPDPCAAVAAFCSGTLNKAQPSKTGKSRRP